MKKSVLLAIPSVFLLVVANLAVAQETPSGKISFHVEEGGIGIGGEAGEGTLTYEGEEHPVTIKGISAGLTFGIQRAELEGEVFDLQTVEDIEGVYTQAEGVAAAGGGVSGLVLQNDKGVSMELTGRGEGLEGSLDLGGMEITLQEN